MKTIASYIFESNALFISDKLKAFEITSVLDETNNNGKLWFEIKVNAEDVDRAKALIRKMEIDESAINLESVHAIEDNLEWSNKMYLPGYYTGGYIPHYDRSYWKYLAPLFILLGMAGFVFVIYMLLHPPLFRVNEYEYEINMFMAIILSSASLLIGIGILRRLIKEKKRSKGSLL